MYFFIRMQLAQITGYLRGNKFWKFNFFKHNVAFFLRHQIVIIDYRKHVIA